MLEYKITGCHLVRVSVFAARQALHTGRVRKCDQAAAGGPAVSDRDIHQAKVGGFGDVSTGRSGFDIHLIERSIFTDSAPLSVTPAGR